MPSQKNTPAVSDASSAPSAIADAHGIPKSHRRYHLLAMSMLRSGTRPTADLLHHDLGGSKSTVVAALQSFWAETLPQMLSSPMLTPPSQPLARAFDDLWSQAIAEARRIEHGALTADISRHQAEVRELQTKTEAFERARAAADLERQSLADQLSKATARALDQDQSCAEFKAHAAGADAKIITMQSAIHTMTQERDRLRDELADQSRAHTAALSAQRDANSKSVAELKAAYVTLDQRLRVELDAARTAVKADAEKHRIEVNTLKTSIQRLEDRLAKESANTAEALSLAGLAKVPKPPLPRASPVPKSKPKTPAGARNRRPR